MLQRKPVRIISTLLLLSVFLSAIPVGAVTTKDITITKLQTFLQSKGFLVIPKGDTKGSFGPATKQALIKYQKSVGLSAQGMFGPETKAKIAAELSGVKPTSINTTQQNIQVATSSPTLSPATTTSQASATSSQLVTEESLNARLQAIYRQIALSQRIDQLKNTTITGGSISGASVSSITGLSTDTVTEGANLYYTDSRADARLSATSSLPNIRTLSGLTSIGTSGTATTFNGNVAIGTTVINPSRKTNTFVLFGDSITNQGGDVTGDIWAHGYFNWANALQGQRFVLLKNSGVVGNTTTQMLARITTDVLVYNPAFVIVHAGINDLNLGGSTASIEANLLSIYQQILANGSKVIATTITPSAAYQGTLAKYTIWSAVNAWIRNYARTTSNVYLADFAGSYIDSTASVPTPLSGATTDGTHPSSIGAYKLGLTLANVLAPLLPPMNSGPVWNLDTSNLVPNGLNLGTTTASTPTGWSGVVPTGWLNAGGPTAPGTCVGSSSARSDGLGNWWQVAVTTTNVYDYCGIYKEITGYTVGQSFYFTTEVNPVTTIPEISIHVQCMDAAFALLSDTFGFRWQAPEQFGINPGPLTVRSNTFTVPANTAHVFIFVTVVGQGTVQFGREGVYLAP